MSTSKPEDRKAPTQQSAVTVNSPERRAHASVPPTRTPAPVRTEQPTRHVDPMLAFVPPADDAIVGNPNMLLSMRQEGQLGIFYPRDHTSRRPDHITVDFDRIRIAVQRVLRYVFNELFHRARTQDNVSITQDVNELVLHLSNGISVMFYLKMYNLNNLDTRVSARYRNRPEVPAPFEVPSPYALAITQFGQIKLSGMSDEIYLCPTVPEGSETTFGCQPDTVWSPVDYARSVATAKRLGMRFSSVDLQVKIGSSWWLFRPTNEGHLFRLDCPYPEENFTDNTAALATLFCNNENGGFNNPIIDTAPLGNVTYCSFLRNPPADISYNCFYAITEESEIVYLFDA